MVMLDGVGSSRRGLFFEERVKGEMGRSELAGYVKALEFLGERGVVDLERVCVSGSSYGGYLSLMCLASRPDLFRVCVARFVFSFFCVCVFCVFFFSFSVFFVFLLILVVSFLIFLPLLFQVSCFSLGGI